MTSHATQLSEDGSLLTTARLKPEAPPDWALRLGELIELLTEAIEEGGNTVKVNEGIALLEGMQAECIAELMRSNGTGCEK